MVWDAGLGSGCLTFSCWGMVSSAGDVFRVWAGLSIVEAGSSGASGQLEAIMTAPEEAEIGCGKLSAMGLEDSTFMTGCTSIDPTTFPPSSDTALPGSLLLLKDSSLSSVSDRESGGDSEAAMDASEAREV